MKKDLNIDDLIKHVDELTNKKPQSHASILDSIIAKVAKVDFRERSDVAPELKLMQKHYRIICIDELLNLVKRYEWGLCRHHSTIYIFNGTFWSQIGDNDFEVFLGRVAKFMGIDEYDAKDFEFRKKLLKQFESSGNLSEPENSGNKVLINLANGTLEIDNGLPKLRDFDTKDFLRYQLPFDYDTNATAPMFAKYLDEVLPDKKAQRILAEFVGYVFLRHGTLKMEKALFLYGDGSNGKSVFFEIVIALLGSVNTSTFSLENLTDKTGYYRAMIENNLLNYSSEISPKMNTETFKQMVSGEPVEARLPYKKPFRMTNHGKFIFNLNKLPNDVEQTHAFFRRFLLIPFDVTIKESDQDIDLPKKIIGSELSGVFNWALGGLSRLLEQKKFTESKLVSDKLEEFRRSRDSVLTFLDDEGYKPSKEHSNYMKAIYSEYKEFCHDNGLRPVSSRNFRSRLESSGVEVKRWSVGYVVFVQKSSTL